MRRIVPGPFYGSRPASRLPGEAFARRADLCCSAMAASGFGAVWAVGWAASNTPDPARLLALSSACLLGLALPGLWLVESSAETPVLLISRIASRVSRRLKGQAVVSEDSYAGVAGLIGDLGEMLSRLAGGGPFSRREAVSRALQYGRDRAQRLAYELIDESATLNEAASGLEHTGRALEETTAHASEAVGLTEGAVAAVTSGAIALARAVRATTAEAQQAAAIAVKLAETAFGTQRCVAGLDDKTAHLMVASDTLAHVLRQTGALGQQAGLAAARAGGAGAEAGDFAVAVQRLAAQALAGLHDIQEAVSALRLEAGAAAARLADLEAQIAAQSRLGEALGHAVSQQGDDVTALLARLTEAQSGFVMLRASVDAVTRTGVQRMGHSELLRRGGEALA